MIFRNPPPLETSVLTLLHEGEGLKIAVKISSHRFQVNKLNIGILKGCFIFWVLKN